MTDRLRELTSLPEPCNYSYMTTTQRAEERGADRAITMQKHGQEVDADKVAAQLYPDNTELQNACAKGLRR